MAGHSDPHIWLDSRYPTPKDKRMTYAAVVRTLLEAGWPRNRKTLTIAAAVVAAESARDPHGYLAYVDLGVDRHSDEGEQMIAKIRALPASTTLTTYRQKVKEIGGNVVRTDNGLFQIGKTFPGYKGEQLTKEYTVQELMRAPVSAKKGLALWKSRGWQPWAAYTTVRDGETEEPYKRFLPHASQAVDMVLAE